MGDIDLLSLYSGEQDLDRVRYLELEIRYLIIFQLHLSNLIIHFALKFLYCKATHFFSFCSTVVFTLFNKLLILFLVGHNVFIQSNPENYDSSSTIKVFPLPLTSFFFLGGGAPASNFSHEIFFILGTFNVKSFVHCAHLSSLVHWTHQS